MTVETNARFINELNEAYPRNRDLIKEGDDHIRLMKSVVKNTFPGIDKAITPTADKLNKWDSTFTYTEATLNINSDVTVAAKKTIDMGGNAITNVGAPVELDDVMTLRSLQGNLIWPVGSIYMTVDARNPSEILGFGNWEKFAAGRMIIGSGSTTDAANETRTVVNEAKGGQYAAKLTDKQIPAHSHGVGTLTVADSGAHDHNVDLRVHSYAIVNNNSWTTPRGDLAGENSRFNDILGAKTTAGGGAHGHKLSGDTAVYGEGKPFDTIPPFIACNIWKRVADTPAP
ncbi:MAG: phage baseplate protein [Fusobacteriaceae bacterium]